MKKQTYIKVILFGIVYLFAFSKNSAACNSKECKLHSLKFAIKNSADNNSDNFFDFIADENDDDDEVLHNFKFKLKKPVETEYFFNDLLFPKIISISINSLPNEMNLPVKEKNSDSFHVLHSCFRI